MLKQLMLRYLLLDKRLQQEPHPSLEELKTFLESNLQEKTGKKQILKTATIKTDLKNMKKEFDAPIGYSFGKHNYFYGADYTFLKLPNGILDVLIQSLQNQPLQEIKPNNAKEIIASGILNKKVICFTYKSMTSKRSHTYELIPYLLKEHVNKLYLVGLKCGEKDFRLFSLDGIIGLPELTGITTHRNEELDTNMINDLFSSL